ncbi:hypothetical protein [Sodalis sp.]|uniref:hypothetical protein n=1 Tax=Sodalis sp. (in: enterobacteria) TaxID=1898979 RepID=UPI003873355C
MISQICKFNDAVEAFDRAASGNLGDIGVIYGAFAGINCGTHGMKVVIVGDDDGGILSE